MDTDFAAKLIDVYPDGRSINVAEGILRARYRESLSRPKPLEPGKVYQFVIEMPGTSNVFLPGHRIRVNALLPGWTLTDMAAAGYANDRFREATLARTPVRRWADPDEMGAAAVFLADPTATFHTGDSVVVDGGYTVF